LNLSDEDINVISHIVDNPKCTITDVIKSLYPEVAGDEFKKIDSRLRKRLSLLVDDEAIIKINGYNPARYQANPEQVFKGHGEIGFEDIDDLFRTISYPEYIVVAGPGDRIVIRPLRMENDNSADEKLEDE